MSDTKSCTACKTENTLNVKYCIRCGGANFSQTNQGPTKKCLSCFKLVSAAYLKCGFCGSRDFEMPGSSSFESPSRPESNDEVDAEFSMALAGLEYQSSIAHFLRAIWFIICNGIFAGLAWAGYASNLQKALDDCAQYDDCHDVTFGMWTLYAIMSLGFFVAAAIAGGEARKRLKNAGQLNR